MHAYVFFNTSRQNENKGYLETAADWCFTPVRAGFNGKDVLVHPRNCDITSSVNSVASYQLDVSSNTPSTHPSLSSKKMERNGIDADSSAGLGLLTLLGIVPGTILKGTALLIDSKAREDHYTLVSAYDQL